MNGERYIDDANRGVVNIAAKLASANMPTVLGIYDILRGKMRFRDIALLGCLYRFFLCVRVLGRRDRASAI